MQLVPITAISFRLRQPGDPRTAPGYELRLACGHTVERRLQNGPIPKRRARCPKGCRA